MHTHTNAHVYSCRAVSIACVIDRVRRSLRMRQDHTLAGLVARCIVYVRKSVCNFIIHKNTTDMFITFLQYRLIMALYWTWIYNAIYVKHRQLRLVGTWMAGSCNDIWWVIHVLAAILRSEWHLMLAMRSATQHPFVKLRPRAKRLWW